MKSPDKKQTHAEYMRKWRERNKEKWAAYMAQWRADHADELKAQRKAKYAASDKEAHRAYNNAWYHKNKERLRPALKAMSANKRYDGRLTAADVLKAIQDSGNVCHWCGKTDLKGRDLTLEHIERANRPDAIVIACYRCNASRRSPAARIVNQWGRSK